MSEISLSNNWVYIRAILAELVCCLFVNFFPTKLFVLLDLAVKLSADSANTGKLQIPSLHAYRFFHRHPISSKVLCGRGKQASLMDLLFNSHFKAHLFVAPNLAWNNGGDAGSFNRFFLMRSTRNTNPSALPFYLRRRPKSVVKRLCSILVDHFFSKVS